MQPPSNPRIVSADRLSGGVIIMFDDGKCALYSENLLRSVFPQAKELNEAELDD